MTNIFTPLALAALIGIPGLSIAQEPCTPHTQVSNNFENGLFIEEGGQMVAQDFMLYANIESFSLTNITTNMLAQGGIASVNIYFYQDQDSMPGELYGSAVMGVTPTSQEIIGSAFSYDIHEVVLDLPAAVDFPGNTRYWIRLEAVPTAAGTQIAWEVNSANPIGLNAFFDNENTTEWTDGGPDDGVFTLSGECVMAEGCFDPLNLMATATSSSDIEVTWDELGDATSWNIEYGPAGFTPGSGTVVTDSDGAAGTIITDMEMFQTYDIYVQSVCGAETSNWTGPVSATIDYCQIVIDFVEPITYVSFAGIENTTSADATEVYEDFTDMTANVSLGQTFDVVIEGNTAGDWTNPVTVFIDWNQDLSFDPVSERYDVGVLENSTGTDGQEISTSIEVPADALTGTTRMRVVKMYSGSSTFPLDGCSGFSYGQVEDYTVEVSVEVGIVDFGKHNFTIGPNPATDMVTLKSDIAMEGIMVYDMTGKLLISHKPVASNVQVNTADLANGIYLMKVTIAGEAKTFKIIKN